MLTRTGKRSEFKLSLIVAFIIALGACTGDDLGGTITNSDNNEDDTLPLGNSDHANVLALGLSPGNDTTEIRLNWYSTGTVAGKAAKVKIAKDSLTGGNPLLPVDDADCSVSAATTGHTAHKAAVKNLEPGSNYKYAVSSDGINWSEAYDYKVPADNGKFTFAVITDPHIDTGFVDNRSRYPATTSRNADVWKTTTEIIAGANASLIVSCGDHVDNGVPITSVAGYKSFFEPEALRSIPLAPAPGNHDRLDRYNFHFNWPNPQTFEDETVAIEIGRNYFYRYNNVLFVVLNTSPYPASKSAAERYIPRYDATIKAAKAAHTGKYDWVIVQHHKSTASVAEHCADYDIQYYVEAGFEKIMSDNNVDFVIAGHDHIYARSYPLSGRDGGKVSVPNKAHGGNEINNPNDPIYLTFTSSSGQKFYPARADNAFRWEDSYLGNRTNPLYPYLGEVTDADGNSSTFYGSSHYLAGRLPVSNVKFVQPFVPSYTIVDVNDKTITFKTYAIATVSGQDTGAAEPYSFSADIPYDWVTVTKN
jgi:hypothetical protein